MTTTLLTPPDATPTVGTAPSPAPAAPAPEPWAVLDVMLDAAVARFLNAADQDLGHLETQALHDVQALRRETTQRAAQAKADATPPRGPVCGQPLRRCSSGHARTVQTRFGDITLQRTRGYCKRCHQWRIPADAALGLDDTAGYSPGVQALAPWPPASCPSPTPAWCWNS